MWPTRIFDLSAIQIAFIVGTLEFCILVLYYLTFDIFVDGTTNFAHGYPSFAVSVGVLFRGKPAAAAVVLIYTKLYSDL